MEGLTNQQIALLLATRVSENAQTLTQLATNAETTIASAHPVISSLVEQEILEPIESYDNMILYGYAGNDRAQAIYNEIHSMI